MVRKRLVLQQKVRALTGEGRMQASVLIALPILTFVAMYLVDREYAQVLLDHPSVLAGCAASQAIGILARVNPSRKGVLFFPAFASSEARGVVPPTAPRGLRRSFQSLELFEDLTIEANIRAGSSAGSKLSWITDLFWPRKEQLPPQAVAAINEFALAGDLVKLPPELPYGRRRLVGIARAVASAPSIIMLDEPAAGLDETESRELAHMIRRLAADWKIGVLLVEHDVGLVMSTCDRIVVIDFGSVIASGTPAEVRDNPLVRLAYLGEGDVDESALVDRDATSTSEAEIV
jgi:ABC-type branched-subunit amino acid transport system ATPase component